MFFSVHLVWKLSGDSIDYGENFSALLSNFDRRVQRYNFGKLSGTKLKSFWNVLIFRAKRLRKGCQNCFSRLHGIILGRKLFSHFPTLSQNFLDSFQIKFGHCCQHSILRFENSIFSQNDAFEQSLSFCFSCFPDVEKKSWVFGETISVCTSNFNSSSPKQRF